MKTKKGKSTNIIQIFILLILLSYGGSWLLSMAQIPLEMTKALTTGTLYTGQLEYKVDEFGIASTGITYENTEGAQVFIPAERLSDLTLDFFGTLDQAVYLDEAGGTFWLTYEDLGIAFVVLLVAFFAFRLIFSLLLSVLNLLTVLRERETTNIKVTLSLLLKPIRMFLFGYILVVFYQHRIFSSSEELRGFTVAVMGYGFYLFVVVLLRLRKIQRYWNVNPAKEKSAIRYENTVPTAVDIATLVTDSTAKHDNDLIQREKRTFKHETSRQK